MISRTSQYAMLWGLTVLLTVSTADAGKIIRKLEVDPDTETIQLFDGLRDGRLTAKLVPRGETGGAVFIENLTEETLTIDMPDAVVGVHVLPQDDFNFDFDQNQQSTGASGQNQPIGTGFPGGNQNGVGQQNSTFNQNPNIGFFSIPSGRTARVPYNSVCLDETKSRPQGRAQYRFLPVKNFSSDARLTELLSLIGTGKIKGKPAQAAAWHITNDMSWDDLKRKEVKRLNAPNELYFSKKDLDQAKEIISKLKSNPAESSVARSK